MFKAMMRFVAVIFLVSLAILLGITAWSASASSNAALATLAAHPQSEALPAGVITETIASGLHEPVALAFDPNSRLFMIERTGAVRLILDGVLQAAPVITFAVDTCFERGMLGLALDPEFSDNHYIYVQYTAYSNCGNTLSTVSRFTEQNGTGINPTDIFTTPFTLSYHTGNNIHFGPDNKLYISTGDNADASNAQNLYVPLGKFHRINTDGTIPPDNPVFSTLPGAVPSLYAIGVRNSFDFTFDPIVTGRIWASENGPSCDDEMNRIEGGFNYGWRDAYPCDDGGPNGPNRVFNTIRPEWYVPFGPCCISPTGIEVYTGTLIPGWHNNLFMCTYVDGVLHHFYLSDDRLNVTNEVPVDGVICNMDLQTGPDGALYYIQGGGVFPGTLNRITAGETIPTPTITLTSTATSIIRATATRTTTGSETPTPTLTETATEPPTNTPTITSTPTATTCTIRFEDVPKGSPFYAYVQCMACRNIITGYPCGGGGEPCNGSNDPYFRPGSLVTRGQLAKIVSNAAGFDEPTGFGIFQDVPESSSPFFIWVQRLTNRGIIRGYPCGTTPGEPCVSPANKPYFRSAANATRAQIAKIIANAANLTDPPGTQTFEDVIPGSTFYDYVERLAGRNAISGYPCGATPGEPCIAPENRPYFRPSSNATRGQVSKIVSAAFFPACQENIK